MCVASVFPRSFRRCWVVTNSPYAVPQDLVELGSEWGMAQSVWTIDLASMLAGHGVRHRFCTKNLGVDYSYADEVHEWFSWPPVSARTAITDNTQWTGILQT